jgi:hypothetical protein
MPRATKKKGKAAKKAKLTKLTKKAPRPVAKAKAQARGKAKPKAKAKATAKAAPKHEARAKPKATPKSRATDLESHPGYALLVSKLKPGRHAGGTLFITKPGAHDVEMGRWLMGKTDGRRSLGRTAFGDIVFFRDLRERASALGVPGADKAGDVAIVDIHRKQMTMIAESAEGLLRVLDDDAWQRAFLRADMYREARARLGDYADDECFCFKLALALGGSEDASSVQRARWDVHQDILIQT